jgi:hypothetical protein
LKLVKVGTGVQEYQQAVAALVQPWSGEGVSLMSGAACQTTLQAENQTLLQLVRLYFFLLDFIYVFLQQLHYLVVEQYG